MLEIKFNNEEIKIPVTKFRRLNDNVIYITGVTENTSGFKTYIDDEQVGDFSGYTTIYRVKDDVVYFSNDGSIYQNPKAIVKVNFDNDVEAPEEVKVILNTGEEVVVTAPWTTEIEYIEGSYPYIESATDVNNYEKLLSGLEIDYVFITEEERTKREINELKIELSSTDYKIIKCIEYQLANLEVPYDISELHAIRQSLRDRINELGG